MTRSCVCLDVGSGWVKALGVDAEGEPLGCAQHVTTPGSLLECVHAAASAAGADEAVPGGRAAASDIELLACSSVGGGLRLAVIGQGHLASTEAGHQVACSAGARVVYVHAGPLEPEGIRALRASRPDVVLLLGGSGEGGDAERVLLANAAQLAKARVRAPIVLAAAGSARAEAAAVLRSSARTVLPTDPVLSRSGQIVPEPARAAVRELLDTHLVVGRVGSAGTERFRQLAPRSTPAAVRAGLAELVRVRGVDGGAVLVIDVGCSTTDVYSALPPTDSGAPPAAQWSTVEADLGLRWSAPGILTEGQVRTVIDPFEADLLTPTAQRLADEPDFLPHDVGGRAEDRRLAALASVLAARRHLRIAGPPLRAVGLGLVLLTGGVFRQPDSTGLATIRDTLRADELLRELLSGCPVAVDDGFALAPAGLLAAAGRRAAALTVLDTAIAPDDG
ncbi:MAG: glutamate mutase L [Pseudonocardia sp.]|nr:glutamate mutase L [Pseudonocardia sp.]